MKLIRLLFVRQLTTTAGVAPSPTSASLPIPVPSWKDAVDEAPLRRNGGSLRVPYSVKPIKCKECKRSRSARCTECGGTTLYDRQSLYFLDQVCTLPGDSDVPYLRQDQFRRHYFQHPVALLRDSCIRYYGKATEPVPSTADGLRVYTSAFTSQLEFKEDRLGQNRCSRGSQSVQDPEVRTAISAMFRDGMVKFDSNPSPYEHVSVKRILGHEREGKRRNLTVFVAGRGSTHCMNKLGEHKTNSVYFVISTRGVQQRCFCRCDVQRRYGTCKTYSSGLCRLPSSAARLLFPTTQVKSFISSGRMANSKKRKLMNRLLRVELTLTQSIRGHGNGASSAEAQRRRKHPRP